MKLHYCAWLRHSIGCASEEIALPQEVKNVGMLLDWIITRDERFRRAFEYVDVMLISVNLRYADRDCPLRDEDEVTFAPPIAGG